MTTNTITNVLGFESPRQLRKTRLGLVEISPVLQRHARTVEQLRLWNFSTALLEAELVKLSLAGTGSDAEIRAVLRKAYVNESVPPECESVAYPFVRELFEAIATVWTQPPFNDPSLIVYDARRHGYHGATLAIEITYRDPIHLSSTHPATALTSALRTP
jgi:hypothetical protein